MPKTVTREKSHSAAPPIGELATAIHINLDEIPDHVRDNLAAATLDFVRGVLRQPGGREALDAKIKAANSSSTGEKVTPDV